MECKVCSAAIELENSRPFENGRICPSCKWKVTAHCPIHGCKTPRRKQTLKPLPARIHELAQAAWLSLSLEFGLSQKTVICCSSCFLKLHRAAASYQKSSTSADTNQELPDSCIPKTGRPLTPYESASTRTKQNIEKQAKELEEKAAKDLNTKLNEISQGAGELLQKHIFEKRKQETGCNKVSTHDWIVEWITLGFTNGIPYIVQLCCIMWKQLLAKVYVSIDYNIFFKL